MVYGWGKFKTLSQEPNIMRDILRVQEKEHSKVTKIKAVDDFMTFQLESGSLYTWGRNAYGAMACRVNPLICNDMVGY